MHARRTAIKLAGRLHKGVYRLTGGRVLGRVANMPVLLLTTTGRRSGRVTTTPLTYLETENGDLVVVGSNGGEDTPPSWWLNLGSTPEATITIGARAEPVAARPATAEEHGRLWPVITGINPGYARYAQRTSRPIPLVVLSRGAGSKENAPGR
jgi:deazaflavin-dependent oxidoreductase (nitroreductase family)